MALKKEMVSSTSFDVENWIFVKNKIFLSVAVIFILIILSLSLINAASYSVKVTNEHPFLLANGKYVPASELKVGDELKTVDGKKARVTKITDVFSENPFEVYNLETALYHDFVLPGGIVVHNSDGPELVVASCDCIIGEKTKVTFILEDSLGSERTTITTIEDLYNIFNKKENSNIYIFGDNGSDYFLRENHHFFNKLRHFFQ